MTTDLDQPVWYAAYGSNLWSPRFRVYLEGGPIPLSTTGRVQEGARDPSPPTGNAPCQIDRSMLFAGSAAAWGGGGVAFLDADDVTPEFPVLGRAWRITLGQFEDVFRQENGLDDVVPLDLEKLAAEGSLTLTDTAYGRVELLESIDGAPVMTITCPAAPSEPTPADISYLKVITDGLIETWSMDPDDAARYLAALDGNSSRWTAESLAAALATPDH